MLSFFSFLKIYPFVLSSVGGMCLFCSLLLSFWQGAPLSSLGNECPLLENSLITNSGSIGLVTKQDLYFNFLGREHKRNYNMFHALKGLHLSS